MPALSDRYGTTRPRHLPNLRHQDKDRVMTTLDGSLIEAPLCLVCHQPLHAGLFAEDGIQYHPSCEPPVAPSKEL
jgi:hypothetical protein